jgi:hypothetical protein
MPVSVSIFDNIVRDMIEICAPETVVDIGPGSGKYGTMLKEVEIKFKRAIRKICIEIDKEKVIDRFNLENIYDQVINEDAARIVKRYPRLTGDLVIAGDVIEHMTKSEGIDLIEYLQYRFTHIFLIIPEDWPSYEWEDYGHESHISLWRPADIQRFANATCVERRYEGTHTFMLSVVNGILCSASNHLIVRDSASAVRYDGIEFGYFNRDNH